jgi:hypothetical protein
LWLFKDGRVLEQRGMCFHHLLESVVEERCLIVLTYQEVAFLNVLYPECFGIGSEGPSIEYVTDD